MHVSADRELFLDGQEYSVEELTDAFTDLVDTADETGDVVNLFLRADESVTYGEITMVMDLATQAGIERISLVQEFIEEAPVEEPEAEPEESGE